MKRRKSGMSAKDRNVDREEDEKGDIKQDNTDLLTAEKTPQEINKQLLEEAKTGKFYNVQEILNHSSAINLNTRDQKGKTVLHYVCSAGDLQTLKLCLERQPDLSIADMTGSTVLHWAAVKGHVDVIEELVNYGMDVNIQDKKSGQTALHQAVRRNQVESVNMLLALGANAQKLDKDGNSCITGSKNEHMKDKLNEHVRRCEEEKDGFSLGGIETKDIQYGCTETFRSAEVTVKNKTENTSQLVSKGIKLTCQRLPVDKVDSSLFNIEESEDVCSDVYIVKTESVETPALMDITIPFSSRPDSNEEIVAKTDANQAILVEKFNVIRDKLYGSFEADVSTFSLIVAVCRKKKEVFNIGQEAATIKSTVDERVEMDIPKGTFEKPVHISMEITEPPSKTEITQSQKEYPDVLSLTSFYSLEAFGGDLTKPVSLKVPLPTDYKGNGEIVVFSLNESPEDETPESWKPLDIQTNVVNGRVEFPLSSFSIKVAIEFIIRSRPTTSATSKEDVKEFGSMTSLQSRLSDISTLSQVSALFKQARRREYAVCFVILTKRQGHSNIFRLAVECCRKEKLAERRSYWANEGFEEQGNSSELETINLIAKQKFRINTTDDITFVGEKQPIVLEFHRKLESFITSKLKVLGENNVVNGCIEIVKLEKNKENDASDQGQEQDGELVNKTDVRLTRFDRSMITTESEADAATVGFIIFRSLCNSQPCKPQFRWRNPEFTDFISLRFLDELQGSVGKNWSQVLLLMGVRFQHLEEALKEKSILLQEKISRLFIEWKGEYEECREKGLPLLLSALCKGGMRGLASTIQVDLRKWHARKQTNSTDPFYKWVSECYKRKTELMLCEYPEPLSDAFLALIFSDVKADSDLCTRLGVPESLYQTILKETDVYVNGLLITMKILIEFITKDEEKKAAKVEELLQILDEMGLNEQRQKAIENLKGWLKRAVTADSAYKRQIQDVIQKARTSR